MFCAWRQVLNKALLLPFVSVDRLLCGAVMCDFPSPIISICCNFVPNLYPRQSYIVDTFLSGQHCIDNSNSLCTFVLYLFTHWRTCASHSIVDQAPKLPYSLAVSGYISINCTMYVIFRIYSNGLAMYLNICFLLKRFLILKLD